jgi:hypothetical protein
MSEALCVWSKLGPPLLAIGIRLRLCVRGSWQREGAASVSEE